MSTASRSDHPTWWLPLLATCPMLPATRSLSLGIGLALTAFVSLVAASSAMSLLREQIPAGARLPALLLLLAAAAGAVDVFFSSFFFELHLALLTVQPLVISTVVASVTIADGSIRPRPVAQTARIAARMALMLMIIGGLRQLISGNIPGDDLDKGFAFALEPAAGFMVAAVVLALINWFHDRR